MRRTYPGARVVRVIDGDTIVLDVDLGFNVWLCGQSFRLAGCNAIERSAPGGAEATANLAGLLPAGSLVTVTSIRVDKYGGRYDAVITLPGGEDLARTLVVTGWAVAWDGKGPKPAPTWPREAQA